LALVDGSAAAISVDYPLPRRSLPLDANRMRFPRGLEIETSCGVQEVSGGRAMVQAVARYPAGLNGARS